jgi:hypothetical protein
MNEPTFPNHELRPTGRASDPVMGGRASAVTRTPRTAESGDERLALPKSRNRHVTAKRLDSLKATLTARDWLILACLNRVRLASTGQLERLCFVGVSRRRARA